MPVPLYVTGTLFGQRIYCSQADQLGVNILHWRATAHVGLGVTLAEIGDDFEPGLGDTFKPLINNQATYRGFDIGPVGLGFEEPYPLASNAGVGEAGAGALPRNTSGLITKKTGLTGRSMRGRMYVPFPSETDNDDNGHPTDGYLTRLLDLSDVLFTPRTVVGVDGSITLTPVLYHREVNATTEVTTVRVLKKWAHQDRRSDYGRPNAVPF